MATRRERHDSQTRKGVFLVVALIAGAFLLGAAMLYLWQGHTDREPARENPARYLTLGEQAVGIGNHSMLIQFTVEYVGKDTEEVLKKKLPVLKHQVVNRMARIRTSDLDGLRTLQGKRQLADDMLALVQASLPEKAARNVRAILYEKFLIGD